MFRSCDCGVQARGVLPTSSAFAGILFAGSIQHYVPGGMAQLKKAGPEEALPLVVCSNDGWLLSPDSRVRYQYFIIISPGGGAGPGSGSADSAIYMGIFFSSCLSLLVSARALSSFLLLVCV